MSSSENISLWKKKAEIDYIPLFMSLWLSLNAWMKDRFGATKNDRKLLNLLKSEENKLQGKFDSLINGRKADAQANIFKGHFAECYRALENANLKYHNLQNERDERGEKVCFSNCITDRNDGQPNFNSIMKTKRQHNKVKIDSDLWIDKSIDITFPAYIETLYQVRCLLFHGNLPPKQENERVVKAFYLTLFMIMDGV